MRCSFKNDYTYGCHPNILKALTKTNLTPQPGYGEDEYSKQAKNLIRKAFSCPKASVSFVSGGTQTNLLMISSALRPYQSVISANTGHIFTNEAGAIEATGHKVHAAESTDGKLTPNSCEEVLKTLTNIPHVVQPKMLYISNSTELGSHYSLNELQKLSKFCKEKGLYLFMDGARLAQALAVKKTVVKPSDITRLVDAFYLGGTKNGALFGEALIITNEELKKDFAFNVKQKGALLAKGRSVGIQFLELLKNNLFMKLGMEANEKAGRLRQAFTSINCSFLTESRTNQLFPILANDKIKQLSEKADFYVWKEIDKEHSAIRLITSWATPEEQIETFIQAIKQLK